MRTFVLRNRNRRFEIDLEEGIFRGYAVFDDSEDPFVVEARPDFSSLCAMRLAVKSFLEEGPAGFVRTALFFTYGRKSQEMSFASDAPENVSFGIGLTRDGQSLRLFISKTEDAGRRTIVVVINRIRTAGLAVVLERLIVRITDAPDISPTLRREDLAEISPPFGSLT